MLSIAVAAAALHAPPSLPGVLPPLASAIEWQRDEHTLTLLDGDRIAWCLSTDPAAGVPFVHPISLPDAAAITRDAPRDHRWHHGLWFCWKYINGVNYWEHAGGTGLAAGATRWTPPTIETRPDGSARVELALAYAPRKEGDEACVLRETRTLEFAPPAEDGTITLDWTATFTAEADAVTLDRTPLPHEPGGQIFGGYAGLSARLIQLEARSVTGMDGPLAFNRQQRLRTRSDALEYAGEVDGRTVGVTILAHPDNLNAPSPWYAIATGQMTFFSPAVICYGRHEMERGDCFTLRYRVIVHPGRWTAERLREESHRFTTSDADAPSTQEPAETGP